MKTDIACIQQLSSEENIGTVIKLIGDVQQEIARQMSKHHQVVNHYMSEYGYIPLWVLVNVLTFGKITTFYKLMKPADKTTVAKKFGIASDELHKYMDMCSLARNKCAHDERFFDIKFRRRLHTKSIAKLSVLNLPRDSSGSYVSGTNDAYAIAIIFAMLLSKTDTKEFVTAMKSAFGKLSKELHSISVDDVMKIMGYSKSWTNLPNLK
jgi:abortive infection bacteriophage resistance protein